MIFFSRLHMNETEIVHNYEMLEEGENEFDIFWKI